MTFDNPTLLSMMVFLALALTALYAWAERRRTARDLAYSNLAFFLDATRPLAWIPNLLRTGWVAALACSAIGAGDPHLRLPLPARDGSVVICIDTSGSMRSADVLPTRAEAARAAARAFIDASPAGTRIGIVAFATTAAVVQPLTADRDQASSALDEIPSPNGATAIGDALRLAAQALPASGHRVVMLITDGVNNAGSDPQAVAAYLGAHHIPVYTIGIGTPNGDVIGGTQSTIDEPALQAYAQVSGGAYARAEDAGELREALARLGRSTSIAVRDVAARLGFVSAGAALLILTLLGGIAVGRYP